MKVKQALVAIGGNGNRLKEGSFKFQYSKPFIKINGKTILYYCLNNIHKAGIDNIIIIGNKKSQLKAAKNTIRDLPFRFSKVIYYKDNGLGTTGLPYHVRHHLNYNFFFEFGHNITLPSHYKKMEKLKSKMFIVCSIFKTKNYTTRPFIRIYKNIIKSLDILSRKNDYAVAAPYLLDRNYIFLLPKFKFNSYKLIQHYIVNNKLLTVRSYFPIEVDVKNDLRKFFSFFKKHPKNLLI
ncbi:MAG: sugar phosphate nucleotidyltransferase [Nanoarchaeota archaeon]